MAQVMAKLSYHPHLRNRLSVHVSHESPATVHTSGIVLHSGEEEWRTEATEFGEA